ncbi:hypothetical protein ACED96_14630 [Clostridium thermobutyricum]
MKKKRRIIVSIIVVIVICIIGYGVYSYEAGKSEVNKFNSASTKLQDYINEVNSNKNVTENDCKNYSNEFKNVANDFEQVKNASHTTEDLITKSNNYYDWATYLSDLESVREKCILFAKEINQGTIANPGPNQIQELIKQLQGILTSNEFVQMESLYNNNDFLSKNIKSQNTPNYIKDNINKVISYISEIGGYEKMANKLSEYFNGEKIFPENAFFNVDNLNENSTNNSNQNNTSSNNTSNQNNVSSNNQNSASSNNKTNKSVNNNNTSSNNNSNNNDESYKKRLKALSGKYQEMESNLLDKYGHNKYGLITPGPGPETTKLETSYYNDWNDVLNSVWGDLKANLPESQMKNLTKQEVEWINSKDGKDIGEQGQMTKERATYLINKYIYQS